MPLVTVEHLSQVVTRFQSTVLGTQTSELARGIITLAQMKKELSAEVLQKAKNEAKRAFTLCIADLEDSVNWNDAYAFRAFSRVLMFAGLKVDAATALSLMFSNVEPTLSVESASDTSSDHGVTPHQGDAINTPPKGKSPKIDGIQFGLNTAKNTAEAAQNNENAISQNQQGTASEADGAIPSASLEEHENGTVSLKTEGICT